MCYFEAKTFDHEKFRERIRVVRHEKGMSQEMMSVKAGLSRNTIHAWENDKIVPGVVNLFQFCSAFDVSMDWISGLSDVRKGVGSCND